MRRSNRRRAPVTHVRTEPFVVECLEERRLLSVSVFTGSTPSLTGVPSALTLLFGDAEVALSEKVVKVGTQTPLVGSALANVQSDIEGMLTALKDLSITIPSGASPATAASTLQSDYNAAGFSTTVTGGSDGNGGAVFTLNGTYMTTTRNEPLTFSFPGLDLSVTGSDTNVTVKDTPFVSITFGVNSSGIFYFNNFIPSSNGQETYQFGATLSATAANAQATGTFGTLPVLGMATGPNQPVSLVPTAFSAGQLDFDIGPNNAQGSQLAQSLFNSSINTASTALVLNGDLQLDLFTQVGLSLQFPTISFGFNVAWDFSNSDVTGTQLSQFGLAPTVTFENVGLSAGQFVSDLLGPIITDIQDVTEPLGPIAAVLNTNIPIVGQTVLGLLGSLDKSDQTEFGLVEEFLNFVTAVNGINPSTLSTSGLVTFGSYTVTSNSSADIRSATDAASSLTFTVPSLDPSGLGISAINSLLSPLEDIFSNGYGFSFPLFTNPSTVMDLLLGVKTNLVTFQTPQFSFSTSIDQSIPIWGPIDLILGGGINIGGQFTCGYDTTGFLLPSSVPGVPFAPAKPADGFYIQTKDPDTGLPDTYLDLGVGITVGIGAGIPDLVDIELDGNLGATLTATLNNPYDVIPGRSGVINDPDTGTPDTDALRLPGIEYLLQQSNGNPLSLLSFTGSIDFYLSFEVSVLDETVFSVDFGNSTLADFNFQPSATPSGPPAVGLQSTNGGAIGDLPSTLPGEVVVAVGPNSANSGPDAIPGASGQDGNDVVTVTAVPNSPYNASAGTQTIDVTANGVSQNFPNATEIYVEGGSGNNKITVAPNVMIPAQLYAGYNTSLPSNLQNSGNLNVADGAVDDPTTPFYGDLNDQSLSAPPVDSTTDSTLGTYFGRADRPNFDPTTGPGDNPVVDNSPPLPPFIIPKPTQVVPGFAGYRNVIQAGGGPTTIYGSPGYDQLYGGSGTDTLYGGSGHEALYAGSGNGTNLYAGTDESRLYGGTGTDTLHGNNGQAILVAGTGPTQIIDGGNLAGDAVIVNEPDPSQIASGSPAIINQTITVNGNFTPVTGLNTTLVLADGGGNDVVETYKPAANASANSSIQLNSGNNTTTVLFNNVASVEDSISTLELNTFLPQGTTSLFIENNTLNASYAGLIPGDAASTTGTVFASTIEGQMASGYSYALSFANKSDVSIIADSALTTATTDNPDAAQGMTSLNLNSASPTTLFNTESIGAPTAINGEEGDTMNVDFTPQFDPENVTAILPSMFIPFESYSTDGYQTGSIGLHSNGQGPFLTYSDIAAITDKTLADSLTYSDAGDPAANEMSIVDGAPFTFVSQGDVLPFGAVITRDTTAIVDRDDLPVFPFTSTVENSFTFDGKQNVTVSPGARVNPVDVDNPNPDTTAMDSLQVDQPANETADVEATTVPTTIDGVAGPDQVNVGDFEFLGSGFGDTLSQINALLTVENGPSFTNLTVNGNADPGNLVLTLTPLDVDGYDEVDGLSNGAIVYVPGDISSLTIDGPINDETYNIEMTPPVPTTLNLGLGAAVVNVEGTGGPLTINGGTGGDVYNVFPQAGIIPGTTVSLAGMSGSVTITGPASTKSSLPNTLYVYDDSTAPWFPTLTATSLSWVASASLSPPPTGGGATAVTALALFDEVSINFSGANLVPVPTYAALTINLGAGGDTVTVNDTPPFDTAILGDASSTKPDTINVNDTDPTNALLIELGGGADTVNVNTSEPELPLLLFDVTNYYNVIVRGGSGADTLFVDDPSKAPQMFINATVGSNRGSVGVNYLEAFVGVPLHAVYDSFSIPYSGVQTVKILPDLDHSFVQALYHQVLQRSASPAELTTWVNVLSSQGIRAVVKGIQDSPEALTLKKAGRKTPLQLDKVPGLAQLSRQLNQEKLEAKSTVPDHAESAVRLGSRMKRKTRVS